MDRRNVLKAAGLLAAGALAGAPGIASAAAAPPPRRPTRIFGWETVGGFVAPTWTLLRAPRLVVYPDRTAIADATRVVTLYATVVEELRDRAVTVLLDPRNLRRRPGVPVIADARATRTCTARPPAWRPGRPPVRRPTSGPSTGRPTARTSARRGGTSCRTSR